RTEPVDLLIGEHDGSPPGPQQPADRPQHGRLPRPVWADQAGDRARFDGEVDALEDVAGPVVGDHAGQLQQRRHPHAPRYDSRTTGLAWTSAGDPLKTCRPVSIRMTGSHSRITRFRSCSTTRNVVPAWCRCRMYASIVSISTGLTPAVRSPSSTSRGELISTAANSSSLRCP